MATLTISSYLEEVRKFAIKYRRTNLANFIVTCFMGVILLISCLYDANSFGNHIATSFQQIGNILNSNIFVVVSLSIAYFLIAYFIIFFIISILFRRAKISFLVMDIIVSVFGIMLSILFVHGTDNYNIFSYFDNLCSMASQGNSEGAIRLGFIFFSGIFSLIFSLFYSLNRLNFKDRNLKVMLVIKERDGKPVCYKDGSDSKELVSYKKIIYDEDLFTKRAVSFAIYKLFSFANDELAMRKPKAFVKLRVGKKIYARELDIDREYLQSKDDKVLHDFAWNLLR